MLKFTKTLLILLSILLILTSCSSKNTVSNTVKPGNSPTSSKTGSTSSVTEGVYGVGYDESKEIDALNTLFDTSHSLQIVKKGGTQYNASSVLTDVIADLLAKAVEVKPDSPAGAKLINGYDFKKYDYKLIFNGAKPLLISIKDNLVHFDGQNTLYELWGDSSKLWENIKYDSKLDKYDLSSSSGLETMVKHYKNDITGNGRMTDINLVYKSSNNSDFKGELLLRIGTSEVSVYKDFSWQLRPEPTINEPPQIKFLSQKGTSNKIIIVYFSRLTGGYSQTGEINTYCYKSGKIQDIDFVAPVTNFKYDKGDKYTAEFPEIHTTQDVRFNSKEYQKYVFKDKTLKDVFSDKQAFYNQPFSFIIRDYNGDGLDELCSMSSLMFQSAGSMSVGIEYTFYTAGNNNIKPAKVIIAPPFDDTDKSTEIDRDAIEIMFDLGKLNINGSTIVNSNFTPSKDYSQDELIKAINKLVDSKQYIKKGNDIFVNF